MQKEVLIHVRGLQMMDAQGDQEPIEIVVPGQYYFRNGSHYLRYEEILDESSEPTVNTTPYGTLQMGIAATNLELTESEENLHMKADYALDMNEEHVADCYLAIQVQPRDCKDFVL